MPKATAIQLNDSSSTGQLFDLKIAVQRDTEGKIVSGLCIGQTTEQNQALLLLIHPGESKEFPTLGVGLGDCLLDDDLLEYRHAVRRNFAADGLQISKLNLYDLKKIDIKAAY